MALRLYVTQKDPVCGYLVTTLELNTTASLPVSRLLGSVSSVTVGLSVKFQRHTVDQSGRVGKVKYGHSRCRPPEHLK